MGGRCSYYSANTWGDRVSQGNAQGPSGLWREICYFDNDDFAKKSLRKFLKSKFKIDDVMFLTKNKASKVIQAITEIKKNMKKRADKALSK